MSRVIEKRKAINLRLKGASYSQIKTKLGISKSTLSNWLSDYPLSDERIKELRDLNPIRIEHFRNTMRKKREVKLSDLYDKAKRSIGLLSKRDLFIAGLFLYWGEGDKSGSVFSVSNTDPNLIKFFMKWARSLGVEENKFRVVLHLYSDMDEDREKKFWSNITNVSLDNFRKVYRKDSSLSGLTYKNGFRHGTCMVRVYDNKLARFILMGIKYIGDNYR